MAIENEINSNRNVEEQAGTLQANQGTEASFKETVIENTDDSNHVDTKTRIDDPFATNAESSNPGGPEIGVFTGVDVEFSS